MSTKFFALEVRDIEKTTADCAVIAFDVPETLATDFQYKQGQYLTLKTMINGEEVRRSYSLCSSPLDGEWKVAVKKVPEGKFSTYANDVLKAGDTLEVMPPNGRFYVDCAVENAKNYVAFAAGSGITPILSIIKTHLKTEPNSTFKLFYINQTVLTIILKEEIEGLKNQFFNRFEIFHFLTQQPRNIPFYNGRMDTEKLDVIFNKIVPVENVDDLFVCGPREMIFLVRDYALEKGMNPKQIHFELFNAGTEAKKKVVRKIDESKLSEVTVIEGGKEFVFKIPQGSDNILDAALNRSADLPFACKGGVCCTCRAKLIEGKVEMEVNYGLEQEEIDAGYILTCQAIPLSKKVVVSFEA
ncbi:MAG: ring-1,2-phenylacetyl-CoA epoxidase subunit PaaE [Paraglaciecola sp.]|jgi:ring-1,2-phenylacetyl-CoA epoxidase subunit PaaE